MANVSQAMLAKSDQLNYTDIGTHNRIIFVTGVDVKCNDQPVSVHFYGCNNRPYKPSKGMIRLIAEAWGEETDEWVGRYIELYGDPTVKWAGEEVGGIRIKAMSDIHCDGIDAFVALNRSTRRKVHVDYLDIPLTDDDKKWVDAVCENQSVIDQITDLPYKNKILNLVKRK